MLKASSLEELSFNSGTYSTEFLAWICANYPQIKGKCLRPYIEYEDGYITVCGKRKRTFDATTEKGMKMKKNAVVRFKKMMEEYKGMSFEEICGVVNGVE